MEGPGLEAPGWCLGSIRRLLTDRGRGSDLDVAAATEACILFWLAASFANTSKGSLYDGLTRETGGACGFLSMITSGWRRLGMISTSLLRDLMGIPLVIEP